MDTTCYICKIHDDKKTNKIRHIKKNNCGSYYHKKCITEWIKINKTCPSCNNSISLVEKIRFNINFFLALLFTIVYPIMFFWINKNEIIYNNQIIITIIFGIYFNSYILFTHNNINYISYLLLFLTKLISYIFIFKDSLIDDKFIFVQIFIIIDYLIVNIIYQFIFFKNIRILLNNIYEDNLHIICIIYLKYVANVINTFMSIIAIILICIVICDMCFLIGTMHINEHNSKFYRNFKILVASKIITVIIHYYLYPINIILVPGIHYILILVISYMLLVVISFSLKYVIYSTCSFFVTFLPVNNLLNFLIICVSIIILLYFSIKYVFKNKLHIEKYIDVEII